MKSDRIYVDSRSLSGEGTGIATYTRGLIAALGCNGRRPGLLRANGASSSWLRVARSCLPGPKLLSADAEDLLGWDVFRLAQVGFDMTGRVLRLRAPGYAGIMHWTYPMPLMIDGWANIYTIHDTIPLHSPHLTSVDRDRHVAILKAVEAIAAKIITVSDAARGDIIAALECAPDRVVNCTQAILPEVAVSQPPLGYQARAYLLFCGRIERRKNLGRLLSAYRASGTTMPLLLVGPTVEGSDEILASARRQPGIRYLNYVTTAELRALMGNARALLLPSLAEGFGLPVAEAMALGIPTLVSRDRALAETAGGASLVVDEQDVPALAHAIARLVSDDKLCATLSDRGRIRAEAFTPSMFGKRLRTLYQTLETDGLS